MSTHFRILEVGFKLTCHIGSQYTTIADLLGVITADPFYMVSFAKDYNVKVGKYWTKHFVSFAIIFRCYGSDIVYNSS